ncbi:MAG: glycoside hydrolase family 16 protein [Spirochaetales bacterium]|nr:glycoside hydrolase family 16 protein [Spirochaetales bacterium]
MELQWYYPSNAWCENGTLIIEGRREQYANPGYDPGSSDWRKQREYAEYTSSSLKTQGLLSWQYGRFEMKAKFKTENGLWPAFWSLGITGEWPSCGEVDIMEYYGGNLLANVAWGTDTRWVAEWDSSHASIAGFGDPDWSDKFHIWRMDWDKNSIKLYVDDILLNTANLSQTINPNLSWGPSNPFRQPHYIIVNLAIGGTAGGDPSATDFPTRYEIDYIRVYQ